MQSTLDARDCDNGDESGESQSLNDEENDGASRNAFEVDRFFGGSGGTVESIESSLLKKGRKVL